MRIHKLAFGFAAPLLLAACSEYVDKIADNVNEDISALQSKINGSCATKSEGDIWYSSKDQSYYRCTGGQWTQTQVTATPVEDYGVIATPDIDTVPNYDINNSIAYIPMPCNENGDKYKVTKDWGVHQCIKGLWVLIHEDWEHIISSSNSYRPTSSSSINYGTPFLGTPVYIDGAMWRGDEGVYQVDTELGNETETYGYWYSFNDNADGGASRIEWPTELGNEYSDDAMDPVIDYCQGLCGTAILDKGTITYNPYTGVAFDIAGLDEETYTYPTAADASNWGGVCLTYTSEIPATLEMGFTDAKEAELGYDLPFVALPKASTATLKCYEWSKFKQAGWGKANISGESASTILASLRFKMQNSSGTVGRFNIMSIGKFNNAAPTPAYKGFSWTGSSGEDRINTNLDAGTETSGYWFSYSDNDDGGMSKITWPVELNTLYSDNSLQPVIEYCGGICGNYSLDKGTMDYNPFTGVGFLVAGLDYEDNIATANASEWGGLCLTYTSGIGATLELGLGDKLDAQIGYDNPFVALPKASSPVTKCYTWDSFKQAGWGTEKISGSTAATMLAAVRFKIQAASGNQGSFNIMEIRSYK